MTLYNLFNSIATCSVILYNLVHYQEQKALSGGVSRGVIGYFSAKPRRGIYRVLSAAGLWITAEIVIISYFQYYAPGFFNVKLGDLLNTGSNYFGNLFSAPWLVAFACLLLRLDPRDQLDLVTPSFPLALFFSKIGCYFAGCCGGIAWDKGYYNPISHTIEFPIQLLEAGVGLLLFIFLLLCRHKLKRGTVFPTYLFLFSAIRFFTEFLRCEPDVFMGLKTYHFLCLFGAVIGAVEYILKSGSAPQTGKKNAEKVRKTNKDV